MIAVLFPVDEMREAMRSAARGQPVPGFFSFMLENLRLFFALFLVLSALTLASAIGLLRRQNWARIVFICIMALGIVWSAGALSLQFSMVSGFPLVPEDDQSEFAFHFRTMARVIMGFSAVVAGGSAVLFGWIIRRLLSGDIRREFSAG
jgi:hypothetical protein